MTMIQLYETQATIKMCINKHVKVYAIFFQLFLLFSICEYFPVVNLKWSEEAVHIDQMELVM